MRARPIWQKNIICGLIYIVLSLSIIFVVYTEFFLEGELILGALCGIIIAIITSYYNMKNMIVARFMGINSAFLSQIALSLFGVPNKIILFVLRNDELIHVTGRITSTEVMGYHFGLMFFWFALIVSCAISIIGIYIVNMIKKHRIP
ncbi:MAG: hypothetical protein FWG61_02015 [Firmicutes bacterium]|nr:hypothetical protein [Bacillota bacterium]